MDCEVDRVANDIKQRIVLEGEKEYSAAIKEAKRNLSVLRSELKAETAELGKNATAQEKNAAKVKNLQKQIAEQEKVVKTYENALKEVKEKYGDNEEAIAKWEIKLNDARAALANMKNSLDDTGSGIKQTTTDMNTGVTAANSLADSFSKLGDVGASVAGSIEGVFTSIIGTISQSVQAVWGELMDIATKSDNYLDLASYFGSTATEVQKWDSAMKSANGSLDTVTSLITKLKYSGKNKEIATWFGISDENFTNDLLYFQNVMQSMYEKRDEMVKAGTWDKAMSAIFGNKKGADVEGVLSDWDDILEGLDRFNADEGGFGLSEDQITKMGELSVQVATLKESWEKLKEMATVALTGNLALNVTGNLQNIVDAFKEYFQAEDDAGRAKAMENIKTNLVKIFEKIRDAINEGLTMLGQLSEELKNSGDPTAKLLGDVLGGIVSALEWFANPGNWDAVKRGFEALIGIWVGAKVASAVGNLASFAAHIATIQGATGLGALGSLTGGGLGSMLTGAGYLAVGIMMVAPAIQKLFDPKTWEQSDRDKKIEEVEQNTPAEVIDKAVEKAGVTNQDLLKTLWNRATYTGGDASGLSTPGSTKETEAPRTYVDGSGPLSPVARARFNATAAQQAAANDFWDVWRGGDASAIGAAYDAMMAAFEGNENEFSRLDEWLDKIMEDYNARSAEEGFDASSWMDLPATWWQNPSGADENEDSGMMGILNGLPRNIASAVTGIKVIMDGQTVGDLIAPYVSQSIARDIY